MGEIAYVDGQLVENDKATISINDRGFLYGDGLFETIRVYDGKPFLVGSHINRLHWGANKIHMSINRSKETLKKAITDTVNANNMKNALARLTVTRGVSPERIKIRPDAKPTIVITCDEFDGYRDSYYDRGIPVITVTDTRSDFALVKSINFLPNLLAKHKADSEDAFEAIFVTKKGFVMEGSTSNVFIVLDGMLITPPLTERVLPGITREVIKTLTQQEGIILKEDAIISEEMKDAEEVFITNQAMEVMPVSSLDGKIIGDGRPGPITQKLSMAYRCFIREKLF